MLDFVDARLEFDALARQSIDVRRGEHGVRLRNPLGIGLLLGVDDVVEGGQTLAPVLQVLAHVIEFAIVLEAFLKIVAREQLIQVAGFGRIGQMLQLPIPGDRILLIVAEQPIEQPKPRLAWLSATRRFPAIASGWMEKRAQLLLLPLKRLIFSSRRLCRLLRNRMASNLYMELLRRSPEIELRASQMPGSKPSRLPPANCHGSVRIQRL